VSHGRIEQWWIEPGAEQFVRMAIDDRSMLLTALNDKRSYHLLGFPPFQDFQTLEICRRCEPWREAALRLMLMLRTRRSINSGLSIRDEGSHVKIVSVGHLADVIMGGGFHAAR